MTAGRCTFRWGTKFEMDNKNSYLDFRVQGPYKHEFAQYPFIYGKLIIFMKVFFLLHQKILFLKIIFGFHLMLNMVFWLNLLPALFGKLPA